MNAVTQLTEAEVLDLVDRIARERLGLEGLAEYMALREAGKLPDRCTSVAVSDAEMLLALLPEGAA